MINLSRSRLLDRHRRGLRLVILCSGSALLPACSLAPSVPEHAQSPSVARIVSSHAAPSRNCLLPAQVRQLAPQFTYIAPRRAVSTTPEDCRLRGGEILSRNP